jgi:transcriptional regulator with XRE-family HTH domain
MSPRKIGKKLKKVRLSLDLKQVDVAGRAGISVNYYAELKEMRKIQP